jgi:hypothetical protein
MGMMGAVPARRPRGLGRADRHGRPAWKPGAVCVMVSSAAVVMIDTCRLADTSWLGPGLPWCAGSRCKKCGEHQLISTAASTDRPCDMAPLQQTGAVSNSQVPDMQTEPATCLLPANSAVPSCRNGGGKR